MLEKLALLSFSDGGWGLVLFYSTLVTISLSLCALFFGLPLGLFICLLGKAKSRLLRLLATIHATVFRGLPELLTLFLIYFGSQILIQRLTGTDVSINKFVAAVIAFSLVFSAFSSEVWHGAFKAIDKGQYEAAKALGFSRAQSFWYVIFPQLFKHAIAGLSNNWLTMLKDTALVSSISLVDIMRQSSLAANSTREYLLFYCVACALYLLLSGISIIGIKKLEKRLRVGKRVGGIL